ncbi:jg18386 [Pararge aegeria aegeria]|uniref:Jg18386 protein n=1 Tax=Pararge aegeria aegeria TaxID=348720 RepID=A0A8S4QQ96_9NEOP|nr:jg18386 [Pararge aegeria aegeria]
MVIVPSSSTFNDAITSLTSGVFKFAVIDPTLLVTVVEFIAYGIKLDVLSGYGHFGGDLAGRGASESGDSSFSVPHQVACTTAGCSLRLHLSTRNRLLAITMRWFLLICIVGITSCHTTDTKAEGGQEKGIVEWINSWLSSTTSTTTDKPVHEPLVECPACR